jgi:hypothetical protein
VSIYQWVLYKGIPVMRCLLFAALRKLQKQVRLRSREGSTTYKISNLKQQTECEKDQGKSATTNVPPICL